MGYTKEYYKKHRKEIIARATEWQRNNRDKYNAAHKEIGKRFYSTPRGIWLQLKYNAKGKGRDVLPRDEFIKWYESQSKECYYCGIKPNGKRLTIDRMDNKKSYEKGNIVLACRECNSVKGSILTADEMKIVGEIVMKKRWQG